MRETPHQPDQWPIFFFDIQKHLETNYGLSNEVLSQWSFNIEKLRDFFGGRYENLRGKIILDLGCGCNNWHKRFSDPAQPDSESHRDFEPWLARALHFLGARVIGIDTGDLEGEKFEHHSIDLAQPDALGFLKDGSVDAVVVSGVLIWLEPSERSALLKEISRVLKDKENIVRVDF